MNSLNSLKRIAVTFVVVILFVALLGAILTTSQEVEAAPSSVGGVTQTLFVTRDVVSGTTVAGDDFPSSEVNTADVYYDITNSGGTTVTVVLQGRNNLTADWADVAVLYTGVETSTTVMTSTAIYGNYTRLSVSSSAGAVTVYSDARVYWE